MPKSRVLTRPHRSVFDDMTRLCKMFCPEDVDQAVPKLKECTGQKDSEQFGDERDGRRSHYKQADEQDSHQA